MSKAQLAGNYAASGGSGDPEYVAEQLAAMQEPDTPDPETVALAADHAETRDHVETADPEQVDIEVRGETIPCDPLGLGERIRPIKRATVAEERGDDMAAAEAILTMLDTFDRVSPDEFDQEFWDRLNDGEVRETFRTLSERSAAGNER